MKQADVGTAAGAAHDRAAVTDLARAAGGSEAFRPSRAFSVTCIGILVADVVALGVGTLPEGDGLVLSDKINLRPGGSALNTAGVLAQWGQNVTLTGRVGDDTFGRFLEESAIACGIAPAIVVDGSTATSSSLVLVRPDSRRVFVHDIGANGRLEARDIGDDVLHARDALHVGGALVLPALDGEPLATVLEKARRAGLTTSLDTTWDATGQWSRVLPCLKSADLFAPGLGEAQAISGESDPARAAAFLRDQGAQRVAIKMGSAGCWIDDGDDRGLVTGYKVAAVDGTGAGDAFCAGLLYGTLAGWTLREAASLGNAAGALCTTKVGGVGAYDLDVTLALQNETHAAQSRPFGA